MTGHIGIRSTDPNAHDRLCSKAETHEGRECSFTLIHSLHTFELVQNMLLYDSASWWSY